MKSINRQLRDARRAKNLTQKDLGDRMGLPQSHISAIESGRVDLRLSTLIEMARVLGFDPMLIPLPMIPAVLGLLSGDLEKPLWSVDDDDEDEGG